MRLEHFEREQILPVTVDQAWLFFSQPRNLAELTPPGAGFEMLRCPEGAVYEGAILEHRVRVAPLVHLRWVSEIKSVRRGEYFIDEQRSGPFRFWHHRHSFEGVEGGVRIRDDVHYAVGFGPIGALADRLFVRRQLEDLFAYRKAVLAKRFTRVVAEPERAHSS